MSVARYLAFALVALPAVALVACGEEDAGSPAVAPPVADSGGAAPTADATGPDAAAASDILVAGPDATLPEADGTASADDVPASEGDTHAPADGADPLPDAAVPADAEPQDASAPDASAPDTSPPDTAGPDDTAAGPVGESVIPNGSFEEWSAGLPVGWVGTTTNLPTDDIAEDTGAAHDGVRSCRLGNASDGHKRFSTAPLALAAGHYDCRYWVRGTGEIRNARYNDDYSGYSSYTSVDTEDWVAVDYAFNLAADAAAFELIFSVRSTGPDGLTLDHVRCARAEQVCDAVVCETYEVCQNPAGTCVTAPGKCADGADCAAYEQCSADHDCVLAPGACLVTADCGGGATPVCHVETHQCVAGDPCAGVACADWQVCLPADASCVPAEGRCAGLADCGGLLPVCDVSTHTCLAVDAPANVVPNGGFESWDSYSVGGATQHLLPDFWYGVCDGCSPYWPSTEIAPESVLPYTTAPHSGTTALQLVAPTTPADRFVSEPFTVAAGVSYHCAYRVRGHGTFRHRGYCGGWNPDTDYQAIDSDAWQTIPFTLGGSSSWCVVILYGSNTVADRDHLQFDDVVCIHP